MRVSLLFAAIIAAIPLAAQQAAPSASPSTALTIYNQDFAVARTEVDLDLQRGQNEATTTQVTSQLEPDSVVLRDPHEAAGRRSFHVVEQNYDAGVVTQDWLLQKYEGKTISFVNGVFRLDNGQVVTNTTQGKIIRAPRAGSAFPANQPLIEIDGKMQFSLPGTPLFPAAATDGLLLKPTLRWQIESDKAQHVAAELAYVTGGLSWEATYNVVVPEEGAKGTATATEEKADLVGWVTIHNQSGTEFPRARIKLMAGEVAKIVPARMRSELKANFAVSQAVAVEPQVTEKAFDDFHLYDLNRTVALADGETKQIQFIEASGVTVARSYMYDGAAQPFTNYGANVVEQKEFGLANGNTRVRVLQQFKNSQANHLGIPLPAGRLRLYRQDTDGQMEFVGESAINHTPTEDTVKIGTGNAFDLKGARRQTDFSVNRNGHLLDETFEIELTNQKAQPVTVDVVEHLYRGDNWQITQKSADFTKLDSHTIQFPVQVAAKGEATLTYTVHYTW